MSEFIESTDMCTYCTGSDTKERCFQCSIKMFTDNLFIGKKLFTHDDGQESYFMVDEVIEELKKLNSEERGKVYKYIRTNLIANLPEEARIKEDKFMSKEEVLSLVDGIMHRCASSYRGEAKEIVEKAFK